MKKVIFLALFLSLGLHASHECKEQSEQREVARAAEVQKLIDELEELIGSLNWRRRKEIIGRLIQVYDVNPNDIAYAPYWDLIKPLADAVINKDLFFASFLLNHGASANTGPIGLMMPDIFFAVRNRLMAQLLFGHGAQIVETPSERLLHTAMANNDPSLIPLYIAHGVDVNALDQLGRTPLINALTVFCDRPEKRKQYISELLKAHALLSPVILDGPHKGLTAPAILRGQLDAAVARVPRNEQAVTDLQEIRAMMKRAYEEGECRVQRDAVEVHLIPDVANMCVESYEELERYQRRME